MKLTTTNTLCAALFCTAISAHAAVTANFTGSTADTAETVASGTANGATTAANLNAGTTGGTWSTPTTVSGTNSAVLVSSGARDGMSGNWLMIGQPGNNAGGVNHLSVASLTLDSAVARNTGTSISMVVNHVGAGGQPGGTLITGWSAGGRASGTALFQAVIGGGGVWGQRDLNDVTVLDTPPTIDNNDIWAANNDATINFNLGAGGYTMTGLKSDDTTPFNIAGNYLGTGDLAVLEFRAIDAKAFNGFDDISIAVVPEPSSAALLGLGGLALVLRRRKS